MPRSRRLYWLWAIALGLLVAAALFSWLIVVPVWKTCAAIDEFATTELHEVPTNPLEARRGDGEEDKAAAEYTIARLGGDAEAIRGIATYLRLPDGIAPYKKDALMILFYCGPGADRVFLEAMKHRDAEIRSDAAGSLAYRNKGRRNEAHAQALLKLLADHHVETRCSAADGLADIGLASDRVVAELDACLSDGNEIVRMRTARAIWKLTGNRGRVLPILTGGLKSTNDDVRLCAIWGLADMGPAAGPALPALEALANDPNRRIRLQLPHVLRMIRKKSKK